MVVIGCCLGAWAWTPEAIGTRLQDAQAYDGLRLSTRAPAIPPSALDTLGKGQVATGLVDVPGKAGKIAWGVAVVDVPANRMFSALNDDVNKADYSKLSTVHLLEGEPCADRRLAFQYLPVPIVNDRWWVIEQRLNPAIQDRSQGLVREMVWTRARDGSAHLDDFARGIAAKGIEAEENDGGWFLVQLDENTTLLQFWALSDPGGAVPAGLAARFASRSIIETFDQMVTLAKRGPTCRYD